MLAAMRSSEPHILIDARMIQASGIGTYLRGLLSALPRAAGTEGRFTVIAPPGELLDWPRIEVDAPIYTLREQFAVAAALRRSGAPLLHAPHYNLPVAAAARTVVTVHDLIHLLFPQFLPSRLALAYARFFLLRIVPRAAAVLTVSEHSRNDLVRRLRIPEKKITVTPPGVSAEFHPRPLEELETALAGHGLRPGYLLYLGNLKEFKNVPLLVEVYQRLRRKQAGLPPLVLVGKNTIPGFEEKLRQADGIIRLAHLPYSAIPLLYNGACALIFPSLYEGFGMPPLEAMASGTPVICSRRASLPEVVGDAALLIDPESAADLEAAIRRVVEDAGLRQKLSAAGLARARTFTWERTARLTWEVYRSCL
jgi:glycosyltransferase involved in cell wall biosynthesis